MKKVYTEEFKEANIEDIYNKIVELYYSEPLCEFEDLAEVVSIFSTILVDKTKLNVETYINEMLDELYNVVLDKNKFDKLVQEKYFWLSDKNRMLVYSKLGYAASR